MARLTLTLLGGFEGRLDGGRPLMLSARKAWALLAYLALPPGQMHPRDTLTALLWGGVPEPRARASLRQAVFGLRRALGEGVLVQEDDRLALSGPEVDVDAVRLERALSFEGDERLESTLALYRGDLLAGLALDEPPFEEWLLTERERIRELALEGLARLLARQRVAGHLEAGVGTALRLLAIDPLQEPVHRTLMRLYAALGRRGDALRQYRECVAVLQRELEVEPEAETRDLYQEILRDRLRQTPAAAPGPRAASTVPGLGIAEPAPSVLGLTEVPLVGRAAELDRLRGALDAAWRGRAQLVLVKGEAGVGKSRLIAELAAEAEARRGRVLVGQSHESDQALPFGPWVDLLGTAFAEAGPDLAALAAPWRTELARLLPELAVAASPSEGPVHHRRLVEAVAACVDALARPRPLLLVLEDLHWADEPSLRLVASLTRRLGDAPVLLVASVREEDLAGIPERLRLFDLVGDRAATVVLEPLSRADTARLVAALGRRGADEATTSRLADRVWAVSAGHPLMVVEATRVYGVDPDAAAPALPDPIHDLVRRRLHPVSAAGRAVLAAAAVAARQTDFAVLQRAAGLGEDVAAAAVEELVRRRLLREAGDGFALTHDRVKDVVYGELLPPRRRLLHRGVGEALEALHAGHLDPHALALGLHFQQAEVWEKAVRYLRQAGRSATERGAYREALLLLRQAGTALERLSPGPTTLEAAIDLRFELRNAALPLGDFPAIMSWLREAVTIAERLGDARRRVRATGFLVDQLRMAGEHDRALGEGQEAMPLAEALGEPALLVLILTRVAQVHHLRGAYRPAATLLRRNLELSAALPAGERLGLLQSPAVHSRYWLAASLGELGAFDEAADVTRDCVAIAEGLGQPLALGFAWASAGALALQRGQLDDATLAFRRALEFVRREEDAPWFSRIAGTLGYALALAGDVDGGRALLDRALEQMAATGIVGGRSLLEAWLAEVRLLAGDVAGALAAARAAVALAERHEEQGHQAWAIRARAETECRDGRELDRAVQSYRAAATLAEELEMRPLVARCRLGLARLHETAGQDEPARIELAEARRLLQGMGMDAWLVRIPDAPGTDGLAGGA
jgi:DNA-binding SARP family transcriptional activator